ncbi:MAG: CRISPR-associated protein Cas4 [Candidatus Korarchaeum sp.]
MEEYFFCPMVFYFRNALGMNTERGLWSDLGKEVQREVSERVREMFEILGEEVELRSERIGLIGKVDFVVRSWRGLAPLEVKYSRRARVWWRYTLVAYAMLLEESFSRPVREAYLYLVGGRLIRLSVRDQDRRTVLRALGECREIMEGKVPRLYESKSCANCDFRGMCVR